MKLVGQLDNRPDPAQPKKKVLYVEDEEANLDVARICLEKKYDLLLARNDREACQILTQYGEEIAIILMDIELKNSKLDGIQLTKLIRGKLDRDTLPEYARSVPVLKTPAIFVTAYGDKYKTPSIKEAGGDRMIPKPVDFVELEMAMVQVNLAKITKK